MAFWLHGLFSSQPFNSQLAVCEYALFLLPFVSLRFFSCQDFIIRDTVLKSVSVALGEQHQQQVDPNTSKMKEDALTEGQQNMEKVKQEESVIAEASATMTDEEEWEYITGVKLVVVLSAVTAACFLLLLDTTIVVTVGHLRDYEALEIDLLKAIPRITSEFHSLEDIGWYGSAYLLANCALQPLTGKLYAQFNNRFTFMFFLSLFEVGSLLCGVARSSKFLIIGRAIAGMGGSGLSNGALTIIASCVPLERRAACLGIMMGVSQLGVLLGPVIGGALTEYTTWRWCFYINLPVGGLVLLFLACIKIPDRRVQSQVGLPAILRSLDLGGFFLFAPSAIMFLLALEWGGTKYNWDSATIIGLFCGSAAVFALFICWEIRMGDKAMVPQSMLRMRVVWCAGLTMLFLASNMMITSYYIAIYFQAVKGKSPLLSGVYTLPAVLSQMTAAISSGFLVGRVGYYLPFIVASTAIAAVGSGLLSILTPGTSVVGWVFFQIVGGLGRGMGLQMPVVAVQNTLKQDQVSVAMAFVIFCQTFGSSLFLSFAEIVFSNGLQHGLSEYAPGINAQTVANAGATGLRNAIPTAAVRGVVLAYNQAVNHVFYLAAGAAVAGFVFSWGTGWKSVRKAKKVVKPDA